MLVHAWVSEKGASVLILHELDEDGVDGKAHEFVVGVARRSEAGSVDHQDHVVAGLASQLLLTT